MLVKFLNSGDKVSTAIAGSYFKGDGWTGAYYDSAEGRLVFESEDGLGFTTGDLRVATGGPSSVEWTTVLNKPTSFTPSIHTHPWADITDKPTEFTPVSHNHTISQVTGLQSVIDDKADKSQILTQQQFRDSVAAMFQSGTHTNVSINYDPVAGTLNLSTPIGPPAVPFVPAMLGTYVVPELPPLPPQLLPNPAMNDPAAWGVANGWTLNGDGTATHSAATGQFSRIAIPNANMGNATDVVLTFDIPAQTSSNFTLGVRARLLSTPGNTSNNQLWNGLYTRPGDAGPSTRAQVSHVWNRVPGQTQLVLEAGNNWAGTIANPRLYDVSSARDLPTLVVVVAGQSNAEAYGAALADPTLDAWHPNVWMCPPNAYGGGIYGARANTVTVAQEPLVHNLSPGHRAGFAMPAAKRIVSLTGGGIRVVIVPVAKSGTGMIGSDAPWNPDSTATGDNDRYTIMINTYLAARSQITNHIGTIMVWSGNEYDMQVANGVNLLPATWANFAARARTDMGVSDMPIIINGPVYPQDAPLNPLIAVQRTLDEDSGSPNAIAGVTYLDGPMGAQWVNPGDTVHWSTAANRIRGDFAGQWAYRIGRDRGWWA